MNNKKLLHTIGFIIIALGITSIVNAHLGASPVDAFNVFLHLIISKHIPWITFGTVIFITGITVTIITYLLNKQRDMLYSAIFLFVVSAFVDGWELLFDLIPEAVMEILVYQIIFATFGLVMCALGVTITLWTGLPASPYERLMLVINNKVKNLSYSKIIVEGSFFILAVILGLITQQLFDQVNVFTVIMTFMMGILVSIFSNIYNKKNKKGEIIYEA